MKRWLTLGLALLLLILPVCAHATDFTEWDTVVHLDQEGNAQITTYWESSEDQGTEKYIVINNLKDDMVISDFRVSDERGEYQNIGSWDIDASRKEKAMKCGIVTTSEGYELCWGFGTYEPHRYEISYVVENMIQNVDDAQILFFNFLNYDMSEYPDRMLLRIEGEYPFDETVKMWGYGFPGEIFLVDGGIEAENTESLDGSNYVTVLLRFEPNTFDATGVLNKSFDDILEQANKGSDYQKESSDETPLPVKIFLGAITIWAIYRLILGIDSAKLNRKKKKFFKQFDDLYYRDFPYDGPWEDLFFFFYKYHESYYYYFTKDRQSPAYADFINAYFLKWIKDGIFVPVEKEKRFGKNEMGLRFQKPQGQVEMWPREKQLYRIIVNIVSDGEVLNKKTMRKNLAIVTEGMRSFRKDFYKISKRKMEEQGFFQDEKRFNKEISLITEEGKEQASKLIMFRNYLSDYSLLSERPAFDVHLWEDYMIYAALYGITEEVEKEFNKLYPNVDRGQYGYTSQVYVLTRTLSSTMYSTGNPSAGSGGSTSIGGGGGSFGGGGGGGTR